MPARYDKNLVASLASSFPIGSEWRTILCRDVIVSNDQYLRASWDVLNHLHQRAGVYAFLLPAEWFTPPRSILLHAPHTHDGPIEFEFSVSALPDSTHGVVYAGKTTDLKRRSRLHLSRGETKDGGQVKFGVLNSNLFSSEDDALRAVREHGRIIYTELSGSDHVVNRDVLEIILCARFAPPFNIKSER